MLFSNKPRSLIPCALETYLIHTVSAFTPAWSHEISWHEHVLSWNGNNWAPQRNSERNVLPLAEKVEQQKAWLTTRRRHWKVTVWQSERPLHNTMLLLLLWLFSSHWISHPFSFPGHQIMTLCWVCWPVRMTSKVTNTLTAPSCLPSYWSFFQPFLHSTCSSIGYIRTLSTPLFSSFIPLVLHFDTYTSALPVSTSDFLQVSTCLCVCLLCFSVVL